VEKWKCVVGMGREALKNTVDMDTDMS